VTNLPPVVSTRAALRESLVEMRPGLVPTLGALHDGHLALIERAAGENTQTVVSIFVNPTQFGEERDLEQYPRHLERDRMLAAQAGANLIFAPATKEVYPPGFDTWVEPGELSQLWEGASRHGHFRGVATVVTILLNLVQPARAYFGEKDFQQLQIIRRMHADLALPGQIVGCATVRDYDGLALSSRNDRLSPLERERAQAIPRAISEVVLAAGEGKTDSANLEGIGRLVLGQPGITIDYLTIVDPETLRPLPQLDRTARLLIAVEIGGVRLIDNAEISPPRTVAS
jgi:pantoate--beta-alanine ligase